MSSIDDAIEARTEIDKIISHAIDEGGLTLAETDRLQTLMTQIKASHEKVITVGPKRHNAFCSYYGGPHTGPCNPSDRDGSVMGVARQDGPVRLSEQDTDVADTGCAGLVPEARYFPSGAYRDGQAGKLDYEGFLSPVALLRYAQYMDKNRLQSDGQMRDSDNWQQGIPVASYMKSMWRHHIDAWTQHRKTEANGYDSDALETSLCAIIFNAFGYLHELRTRGGKSDD